MKIKNNRDNFVKLQVWKGGYSEIWDIKPQEQVNIPYLKNIEEQVVNKFLFNIGNLSVVKEEIQPSQTEKKEKSDKDSFDHGQTKVDQVSQKVKEYTKSKSKSNKKTSSTKDKRGKINKDKK